MILLLVPIMFAITSAHNGTRNYEVCLAEKFKHPACWEAKQLYKAGKWGCDKLNSNSEYVEQNGNTVCIKKL